MRRLFLFATLCGLMLALLTATLATPRSTTAAPIITEFALPTSRGASTAIVAGPDGALWFTETIAGRIGRITTGGALAEYPVPTPNSAADGIAAGSDGALWLRPRRRCVLPSPCWRTGAVCKGGKYAAVPALRRG